MCHLKDYNSEFTFVKQKHLWNNSSGYDIQACKDFKSDTQETLHLEKTFNAEIFEAAISNDL